MAGADVNPAALAALRAELPTILDEGRKRGHDVDGDPYLQLDPENLLRRYLIACDGNSAEAARRLRATLEWRQEWGVLDCHRPGLGSLLFSEDTNPGSEMYFADSGHCDLQGRPYVVGRVYYANAANMHPWRHLQAGIFVIERIAIEVLRRRCRYGSYILDIGEVPFPGTVSGTGGSPSKSAESKNPYYRRRAGMEAPKCLLDRFGELTGGMGVLRAAINVANNHYPELMSRVVILRSNWLFSAAFRIFSVWLHRRSREKFVFVHRMEQLREWYDEAKLPEEFGGLAGGWRLDGDAFMARAIEAYDADPAVALAPPWPHAFAGWDEAGRALAAKDAARRRRGATGVTTAPGEAGAAPATPLASQRTPATVRRRATASGASDGEERPQRAQSTQQAGVLAGMCALGTGCLPCLGHRCGPARGTVDRPGGRGAEEQGGVQRELSGVHPRPCEKKVEISSDGLHARALAGHPPGSFAALGSIFLLLLCWLLGGTLYSAVVA